MPKLILERVLAKKTGEDKIRKQIDDLVERGLAGSRGSGWELSAMTKTDPFQRAGQWVFIYELALNKVRGRRGGDVEDNQWGEIKAMVEQTGLGTRFADAPWRVVDKLPSAEENGDEVSDEDSRAIQKLIIPNVRQVAMPDKVLTWSDMTVPQALIGPDSDKAIADSPHFSHLYGLNAQIRTLLTVIDAGYRTGGAQRFHGVTWGHAGCGKTSVLLGIEQMFGPGSVLRLDATSTTRAGLEKLFFELLPQVPPLVFMEEIEKANEDALKLWLGALDDRGEIRKVNFRVQQVRKVEVLFFCTVNNKAKFDHMMGSDGSQQGALSSRCVTDVYFPEPSEATLRLILHREVQEKGLNEAYVEPALKLAKQLGVTNPRKVQYFLAGGDRLLNGSWEKDQMANAELKRGYTTGASTPH